MARASFRRVVSDSSLYVLGNVLRRGVSIVTMPVFTRYLSPSGYGLLSVVGTVNNLLEGVYESGLRGAATRLYYEAADARAKQRLFGTLLFVLLSRAVPLTCALLVLGPWLWNNAVPDVPFTPYVTLTIVSVLLGAVGVLPRVLMRVEYRVPTYFRLSLAQTLLTAVVSILLVVAGGFGPLGPILGTFAATAVFCVVNIYFLWPHIAMAFDRPTARRALRFGLPSIPAHLGTWTVKVSDRLILQHFTSLAIVGLYSVACSVSKIAFDLIANAINWAIDPFFYSTLKRGPEHRAKAIVARLATYNVAVLAALGLATVLYARELVHLLASATYAEAVGIVPIVAAGSMMHILWTIPARVIAFREKTPYFLLIVGVGGVATVGLDFALIPLFGMTGAAVAMLLGHSICVALSVPISQRVYPIPYEWARLAIVLLTASALAAGSTLIPEASLLLRLAMKSALFVLYPFLLLCGGFFNSDEVDWIQRQIFLIVRRLQSRSRGPWSLATVASRCLVVSGDVVRLAQFVGGEAGRLYGVTRRRKLARVLDIVARAPRTGLRGCWWELRRLTPSIPAAADGARATSNGRTPCSPLVRPIQHVLFICHGNIIRSPLAAALLRKHLMQIASPTVAVASAGLHARPGRPVDPRVRDTAPELGVCLDGHVAQGLTAEMVDRADLILVMDRRDEAELLARYPEAAPKVDLLGSIGGAGHAEIPDAIQYDDLSAIRRCCQLVDECVRALPGRLGLLPPSAAGGAWMAASSAPLGSHEP